MSKIIKLATELVPEVAQSVANEAKELLDMRAVRMVVPCNFPVGCIPKLHVHRGERDGPARVRPRLLPLRPQLIRRAAERAVAGLRRAYLRSCVPPERGQLRRGQQDVRPRTCTIHPPGDNNALFITAKLVHMTQHAYGVMA
jgi:hypothetical protein